MSETLMQKYSNYFQYVFSKKIDEYNHSIIFVSFRLFSSRIFRKHETCESTSNLKEIF